MTNRDVVSQIRGLNKLFSEATINDRTILRECRNVANLLVHQDTDQRKLWSSPNLFTPIPCLEMEEAPFSECCAFESECTVARSIKTIPKIGEGVWGLAIQGVFGLDGKNKFKETNPNRYANIMRLGLKTKELFYWILNDRLYVSNPDTKFVNMYAYFTEDVPNDLLYPGSNCDCNVKPSIASLCTPVLDKTFYIPAYRIADVNRIVEQNLLQSYFNINKDKVANNLDEQSK